VDRRARLGQLICRARRARRLIRALSHHQHRRRVASSRVSALVTEHTSADLGRCPMAAGGAITSGSSPQWNRSTSPAMRRGTEPSCSRLRAGLGSSRPIGTCRSDRANRNRRTSKLRAPDRHFGHAPADSVARLSRLFAVIAGVRRATKPRAPQSSHQTWVASRRFELVADHRGRIFDTVAESWLVTQTLVPSNTISPPFPPA
jgi:hypothetical protein